MENEGALVAYFLSPEWMILFSLIAYIFLRKPLKTIFGRAPEKKDFFLGVIIFAQLFLVSIILDAGASALGINDTQAVDAFVRAIFSQGLFGAGQIIFSALAEEVFFRGIIFTILGAVPSVLLFGVAHAGYGSLIQLVGALAAGVILIRARVKYDSIFPGLVGHVLYNLVVIFVLVAQG